MTWRREEATVGAYRSLAQWPLVDSNTDHRFRTANSAGGADCLGAAYNTHVGSHSGMPCFTMAGRSQTCDVTTLLCPGMLMLALLLSCTSTASLARSGICWHNASSLRRPAPASCDILNSETRHEVIHSSMVAAYPACGVATRQRGLLLMQHLALYVH